VLPIGSGFRSILSGRHGIMLIGFVAVGACSCSKHMLQVRVRAARPMQKMAGSNLSALEDALELS